MEFFFPEVVFESSGIMLISKLGCYKMYISFNILKNCIILLKVVKSHLTGPPSNFSCFDIF